MKLLIAAIAASMALPVAAQETSKEGTWYLVIGARHGHEGAALQSLPMKSEEQCIKAGVKMYKSNEAPNNIHGIFQEFAYVCVKGK